MKSEGLSIIIPTYNEESNIGLVIERLSNAMADQKIDYEIIFIDDHSKDKTQQKVNSLKENYPIQIFQKIGKKGKGYSITEGFSHASFGFIAMMDADLQYPPEIIPDLFKQAKIHGFAVAKRKTYQSTLVRRVASRLNAFVFGRLLLNLKTDVQSGLKIFNREVFEHLNPNLISAWGTDIPLIFTAYELGYEEGHVDFDFRPRVNGTSNVRFIETALEIAKGAIKTRFSNKVFHLKPEADNTMLNSGVVYKRKRFITHSSLSQENSALVTFTTWQKVFLFSAFLLLILGFARNSYSSAIIFVALLTVVYFLDVIFNLIVVLKSLHFPPEIKTDQKEIEAINEKELPTYSILCPLYHEANVLPQFVDSMSDLDWPKEKLEVLLLLEENDKVTIEAAQELNLPNFFKIVIVPHSEPKTKPKACNYGLGFAKGEYLVVYDAEDKPDPQQLKKAYLAFSKTGKQVACLQAKLNYYNPRHNLLTRFFTAEYSLWFDVILPGLQSIDTSIPLGGTSNHFRTNDLLQFRGWDPFNVTEDCDLGIRLFKAGYKTAIIDSTTYEEANSNAKNWFRQRSRWIKGYLQTYLVHMRKPLHFVKNQGFHAFIFQLIVGGKIAFMLINPILWIITISYFTLYSIVGPTIESLFPTAIFYMAVFSLVFGNFICIYNYMIGCAKREHWDLIKYIYFVPVYWLMISIGAGIAVFQLFFKPHYWEKTIHGFHLEKEQVQKEAKQPLFSKSLLSSSLLVFASLGGNFINFLYNAYLGRVISLEEFGLVSLIGSFVYISQVPLGALSQTINHRSAYLLGKFESPVKEFWRFIRRRALYLSSVVAVIWIILTPILQQFFQVDSPAPFLLFTPVWIIGILASVDGGFLGGNLKFTTLAVLIITEATFKLFFSILFVKLGFSSFVYAAVPISMTFSFIFGWWQARKIQDNNIQGLDIKTVRYFPQRFFGVSILMKITNIAFLGLDVILAKHFLSPIEAGKYSLLALIGKMVYFFGSLFVQFIVPKVSKYEGSGQSSRKFFNNILIITIVTCLLAFVGLGIFGNFTVPLLWGSQALDILPYLPLYTLGMVYLTITFAITSYHVVRKHNIFPLTNFILALAMLICMSVYHQDIQSLTTILLSFGAISLVSTFILHIFYKDLLTFETKEKDQPNTLKILIFNWRDTRHVWAGGAEVYIHELAKRWANKGHKVTLFCGNDKKSPHYETIEGVEIIRRGGFYLVYFWAFVYYMFKFRGKYDVIIDCENGIPFFTPLFAKEKTFLLIHHIHQEVFTKGLVPPFSWLASFLELKLMPFVYRDTQIVTVSPSSKADILDRNLTKLSPRVIYNGVDLEKCKPGIKNQTPLVLYLGRLKFYKSLEVLIDAAKKILEENPIVKFIIAGDGEEKNSLQNLVKSLGLEKQFEFVGHVSDIDKVKLLQKAWVFTNPSLMEGWGITVIEANACGTPVVASNVPGLRDSVHNPHSGFLVPYGNSKAFAEKILKIINNSQLRKQMGKDAVAWANNFDWDESAKNWLDIITKYVI